MPIEILMPALSPTMEEGTLAKWLVSEGDSVSSGDILCEIETDKATMEFEAVDEGTIGKILIGDGSEGVKVNTPIAVLLEEGEEASDIDSAPAPAAKDSAKEDAPDQDAAPEKGYGRGESDANDTGKSAPAAPKGSDGKRLFVTPLARRIAADKGVDLTELSGSGPHGRIIKADVEAASAGSTKAKPAESTQTASAPATTAAPAAGPSADAVMKIYEGRAFEEISLNGMRKTIAARLTEAKQSIPHFYLRRDIELDALLKFRGELNKQLEARDVKLSVNDFIIKACALALQTVSDANAVWAGDRILKLKPSDVAVAVAIEGGLFTPVLKDAEMKSLSTLSAEMKDLAARARDRKLAPHEYQGGSFAVSNLGMFGIKAFDAIINPPQGAILAVGAGEKRAVVVGDSVSARTVMTVTLSCDHRVIDGALGATFLRELQRFVASPALMLV